MRTVRAARAERAALRAQRLTSCKHRQPYDVAKPRARARPLMRRGSSRSKVEQAEPCELRSFPEPAAAAPSPAAAQWHAGRDSSISAAAAATAIGAGAATAASAAAAAAAEGAERGTRRRRRHTALPHAGIFTGKQLYRCAVMSALIEDAPDRGSFGLAQTTAEGKRLSGTSCSPRHEKARAGSAAAPRCPWALMARVGRRRSPRSAPARRRRQHQGLARVEGVAPNLK